MSSVEPGQEVCWDGGQVEGGQRQVIQGGGWQGERLHDLKLKTDLGDKHLTWSKEEMCLTLSLAAVRDKEERAIAASPNTLLPAPV